jgi:large repetitive protein
MALSFTPQGFYSFPLLRMSERAVLANLQNGNFSFTKSDLEQIYGSVIPDGLHTLNLVAKDQYGNQSSVYSFSFTLDTTIQIPTLNLAVGSDTGISGDYRTKAAIVNLTGKTEANAQVLLAGNPTPITADAQGNFTFTNLALTPQANSFTVTTTDIAGNVQTYTQVIYRTSPPTAVNLSTPTVPENSLSGLLVGSLTTIDPDGVDNYAYSLVDNAGGRFQLVGDKIQVANGNLLDFEASQQHQIQVRTTDSEGDSYLQTIAIEVKNVNEAPTALNISKTAIAENIPAGSTVGILSSTDPDFGDTSSFSLVAGTGDVDNSAFTIIDRQLIINQSPDFEAKNNYSLRLRVTDAGGLNFDRVINISVTDVNEAPSKILLSNSAIAENSSNNVVIANLTTVDPDIADTAAYALLDGAQGRFVIVGNQLQVANGSLLDFEANKEHQITISSTDQGGLAVTQTFAIQVTNVNEAPLSFTLSNNLAPENTPVGSVAGSFTTIDPDAGDTHVYSLINGVGGSDNNAFTITSNQLRFQVSPDFETKSNYALRVKTTDAGGLSIEKQLTVNITNVNEAPTKLVLDVDRVAENSPIGTLIGKLTSTDPDAGDTHVYSLITGTGDQDNAKFSVTSNELRLNFVPDFEAQSVYHLRLQTKDAGGLTWQQELTVNILDLSENLAPTGIGISNSSIAENSAINTLIAKLNTTDPDTGNTHIYTLLNGAGGRFKLVGNELRVANGLLLDFETATSHQIRVRTTDNGTPNLAYEQNLTIGVTNVNEAPLFSSQPILFANVGQPYSYLITTIDPDTGDSLQITANRPLPSWLRLVDNGDGTAQLSGNPGVSDIGFFDISLAVTDAAGIKSLQEFNLGLVTTLVEGTSFNKRLEIAVNVPATGGQLSFKLDPLQFDSSDLKGINDALEVSLIDAQGKSLVSPFQNARDAFFNLTEGESAVTGKSASYNPITGVVTLDLTGVKPGAAKLVFKLVNDDLDTTTSVRLANLILSPISPATSSQAINPDTPRFPNPIDPSFFNSATDVSPSIGADYHRTSFNAGSKELFVDIALKNQGSYSLSGSLAVVVKHISDPSVKVLNADGLTPEGLAYYTFKTTNGKLDPTQLTPEQTLAFKNPNGVQFSYDLMVLAETNSAPVIKSKPDLEVVGGQKYQYQVKAEDINGDTLSYKLLSAPVGMTIDSVTGLIKWNTAADGVGNYQLLIEVSDGRGGIANQNYDLAVINTPVNRPPDFVSNPVVDAFINQTYVDTAVAVDPDGDVPITYSVISAPPGLTINPLTGEIEWKPSASVILGDTVLSRLRTPGETNEFTFSGTKGQKIYFDPLKYSGDVGQWRLDLYSPTGRKLIDGANFSWDQNRLLTLLEDGNYHISVKSYGDSTGDYSFRLIDTGLVPLLPFDELIQANFPSGKQDQVFRFTGNKDQKLFFDKISNTGDLVWTIYNATNQVIANNYYYYNIDDIEINLPADGDYLLAIRDRSSLSSNYQLDFAVIIPDIITKPISLNTPVIGAILEKGEQDVYTFDGVAGQQLFYDGRGDYFTLRIFDPSGKQTFVIDSRSDYGPDSGLFLSVTGAYKVVVDGEGEGTGNYQFRLLDRDTSTTIALDTNVVGQLSHPHDSVAYHLVLENDQYIYFDAQSTGSPNRWILYNSAGQNIIYNYINDDSERKLDAGNYFLVFEGIGSPNLDYQLRLVTPDFITTPLALGNVVSGNIGEAGEQDTYTFTGTSGQQLFYDALSTNNIATLRVYDPKGREVATYNGRASWDQAMDYLNLSLDGTYKVVIDGDGANTGDYKFRLLDKADAISIIPETEVVGSYDENGIGSKLYRFNVQAGEHYYLNPAAGQYPNAWIIYDSTGQFVQYGHVQDNYYDDWEFDAVKTGEYTLVLQGNGAQNTNYKFTLTKSPFVSTPLVLGSTISAEIAKQGEQDIYTFAGVAGQQLHLDFLSRELGYAGYSYTARIYTPGGVELLARNFYDQDSPDLILLKESGTYKIIVDANGANTEAYSFRILDVSGAANISLNTNVSGQLATGRETDFYQFSGAKGQKIYLDWLSNSPNTQWSLYDSGAQLLMNSWVSDSELVLPNDGLYSIAVRGYHNAALDYQFRLITQNNNIVPITLGSNSVPNTIIGKIDQKGEVDTYTFNGVTGNKIYLDVLNGVYSSNNIIKIYDPTGRLLFDQNLANGDSNPIVLTANGEYRVQIDGSGESTDSYEFGLIDLSQATSLTLDVPITVNLNNGRDTQFYQFTGIAGQRLKFDSLVDNNTAWTLYDSFEKVLFNERASTAREVTLMSSGTYLLGIKGNDSTATSYQFQVQQLAAATPLLFTGTPLAFNTTISGSITSSTPGLKVSYTFAGTAGQKIFYDTLGGDYFRVWIQDPTGNPTPPDAYYTGRGFDGRYDIGPDSGLTLAMTGTYQVTVHAEGGVGNYNFQLLDLSSAPQASFDTDVQGVLAPNAAGGTAYRFNLTQRQHLFFDGQQGDGAWIVYKPNGEYLTSGRFFEDRDLWLNPGEYSIVMQGYNSDANYKFKLTNLSTAPVVDLDTDIQGTFSSRANNIQAYRFNVDAQQYLYFDGQQGDGAWIVYKPNGDLLTTARLWEDRGLLVDPGEYHLVMQGYGSNPNYKLHIVTPDILPPTAINLNTTVSGEILEKGERDIYTFTGVAGQNIFYDGRGDSLTFKLLDPTGRTLFAHDSRYDRGPDGNLVLGLSGTYQVIMESDSDRTGNYQFRLLDRDTSPVIPLDTDVVGRLPNAYDSVGYRFTLSNDQYLYIDSQAGDYPNRWYLYNSAGQNVAIRDIYGDLEQKISAGTYFLVLQGNGSTNLDYKMRLITPEFTTTPLQIGTTVSGNLGEVAEQDTYTFTGVAGQQLFYDSLTSSNFAALRIYDPMGRELRTYSGRIHQDLAMDYLTLGLNGTYKVVVDGDGTNTGNYKFRFIDKTSATAISTDTEIVGAVDEDGIGSKLYRFNAQAGQHYYLNTGGGQSPNAWIVYDPDGQYLTYGNVEESYYYRDDWEFDATKTGEYTLVIQANGAANPNYKFTVTNSPFASAALTFGETISGNITKQGEKDTYTFTGISGQRLQFDILKPGGYYTNTARIYTPGGVEIFSRDFYYPEQPDLITLKEAGNYKIVIDGNGGNTDAYTFRLLDVSNAINISYDTDISGQLVTGQETVFYQFSGSKGQRLYFDLLSDSPNTQWSLYNSSSQPIDNRGLSDYEFVLPNDDTYSIAIRGYHGTAVDYKFRIIPSNVASTPIVVGDNSTSIVNGQISKKGETDEYTFTGTAGQKIFYDQISLSNATLKFIVLQELS